MNNFLGFFFSMYLSLINLGCNKNLVDSQFLLGKLFSENTKDLVYIPDPYDKEVEIVFLNTCGFISSGRQEMFHTIEKLLKKGKKIGLLGCGVQYFSSPLLLGNSVKQDRTKHKSLHEEIRKDMKEEINKREALTKSPNVSIFSWEDLTKLSLKQIKDSFRSKTFDEFQWPQSPRFLTNLELGYEYLKIAEGCNNQCSFCIIPKIRGRQKSLPQEAILKEVKNLILQGVREIIFLAQDSTRYGVDLYGKSALFSLLEEVEKIEGDFQYRVLYLYPDLLTLDHLQKLKHFKKFIPYFDLPFQHISSSLLKAMGRFYDEMMIFKFLDFIIENFEQRFIRTNFIIGFPGETEEDVEKLISFIQKGYFDNIALFEYHDEPLAPSSCFKEKIPYEILHKRFLKVQKIVQESLKKKKEQQRHSQKEGFIQDIWQDSKGKYQIEVRPILHCPEIDETDIISPEKILGTESEELDKGVKIIYKN